MSDPGQASQLLAGTGATHVQIVVVSAPVVHITHVHTGDTNLALVIGLAAGLTCGAVLVGLGVVVGLKMARGGEATPIIKSEGVKDVGPI